ncbi:MAG: TetR/AcrR family transcriptional regulator [Micavibrio sp.]|nr:TetR/AcrR family transcriptional regulator [Micavibrio sp.]
MTKTSAARSSSKSRTPKPRQRRKDARPGEIVAAALELFAEQGFGATKIEDVAKRAGVAKGTLFVYFASKNELFRAVAKHALASNFGKLQQKPADFDRPLKELIPLLLSRAALAGESGIPGIARMIITESRAFPDLAAVWHDEVASKIFGIVTAAIMRAQKRGEIKPGDANLYAFSIMGPMMAALLFREVFKGTDATIPDLKRLSEQHAETILGGLLVS